MHSGSAAVSYRTLWEGFCVTELATAKEWLLFSWQQSLQGYKRSGDIFFFTTWIHPALVLSSCAFSWQVWLCSSYNSNCILWIVVQSSDWKAPEGAPFPHLLSVKDNKNLLDLAMSSHSPLDTSNTDFVSWLSLATSNIMFMSFWPCGYMGQLWSVASFYTRQSSRENKVSAHCQHSTGAWQSISSVPGRNVFQQHYLWQQLRNIESMYCTLNCILKHTVFRRLLQSLKIFGWRHKLFCFTLKMLWNEKVSMYRLLY